MQEEPQAQFVCIALLLRPLHSLLDSHFLRPAPCPLVTPAPPLIMWKFKNSLKYKGIFFCGLFLMLVNVFLMD